MSDLDRALNDYLPGGHVVSTPLIAAFRAGWAAAMERAAGMVEDAGPLLYDRHRAKLASAIRSAGR